MRNQVLPLATLCLLVCFIHTEAQEALIKGVVLDEESSTPLLAATIRVNEQGTVTDIDGKFQLGLPPGDYNLEISYVGFQTYETNISLVAGEEKNLEIKLAPSATLLETATVTSGKFEKSLGEVTVSMEILQPGLIESTGKTSIDQALQKIPGVQVIDGQANTRGGSGFSQGAGSRVLLLIDDIPILDAPSGFPNWKDIPIENVGQVEVVKGASSALYGSSALNGIINVRTAYAKSKPETKGSVFYNTFFTPREKDFAWWRSDSLSRPYTYGLSIQHKRKLGKIDLVLGGYLLDEQTHNKDFAKEIRRFNFNLRYRITDRLFVGLNGNLNNGSSDQFFYWVSDTNPYVGTQSTFQQSSYTRFYLDPFLTYYDKAGNRHKFLSRYYRLDNNITAGRASQADQYYGEYQFQRRFTKIDLVATAGVVASGSFVDAPLYGDTTFTSRNLAAYVQFDKEVADRLNISVGFRFEDNLLDNPGFVYNGGEVPASDERESKPVARFGLNYRLGKATFLRSSFGQGYRYPTIAEKYITTVAGAITLIPNPSLQSETGWSAEIGLKQGISLGAFNGYVDVAGFMMSYDDMMEFNLIGLSFQSVNIGGTEIRGLEVSVAGQGRIFGLPTNLIGGYTFIDPRFQEFDPTKITDFSTATQGQINFNNSSSDEDILKYRSQHLFKMDVETKIDDFSVGIAAFYNSQVEAIDAGFFLIIPGLPQYREENDGSYTLFNGRLAYNATDNLKVSLILNNMFNETYSVRPGILEAPRNLTARLDFNF